MICDVPLPLKLLTIPVPEVTDALWTVTEVAKSIIGSYRRTNVTIDESGKRPAAIIQVEVERADREGVLKRLRDAYAGFAFKTDIQLMEV